MKNAHRKLASQIIPILRDIFGVSRESDKLGKVFKFGNATWRLTPEESRRFRDAAHAISQAFPNVHFDTCTRELERFCCEKITSHDAQFESLVPALIDHIDQLGATTNVVYIQVSGLKLEQEEFDLGAVKIISSNHPEIDAHRLEVTSADGHHPCPIQADVVLSRVEEIGEPKFAVEASERRAQFAMDCLQVLSIPENPAAFDENPVMGFVLNCSEAIHPVHCKQWVYSESNYSTGNAQWCEIVSLAPIVGNLAHSRSLPIGPATISKFTQRGLEDIRQLISDANPSPFDEGIIASIRWIASAVREQDFTKKYLSLYIALEALFTVDSTEAKKSSAFISPAISPDDGVAFLLGKDADERIWIANRVRELARTRNMVVHRGFMAIERGDLLWLADFSYRACIEALKMRDQFRAEKSFREWCLRQKYTTSHAPRS